MCDQKWNSAVKTVLGIAAAVKLGFVGFFALRLAPAGACRAAEAARPAVGQTSEALRLRPRRALSSAEAHSFSVPGHFTDKQKLREAALFHF